MDDQTAEPIANRNSPIPVVSITGPGDSSSSTADVDPPSTPTGHSRRRLSAGRLKHKLGSLGEKLDSPSNVSDRMFNMLLQQMLPTQDFDDTAGKDRPSRDYVNRPGFSLPVMSSNFRRFNARIGVAFVFQNRLIHLFTWRKPSQTISFLLLYTFICLDPYLITVLPLAACLFFIMVPTFLARHPPPPTHQPTDLHPLAGPPLAPAQSIRPAPELSKDFFRNMRDLQNCMEDFSRAHDAIIQLLAPPTNFSNEALSSVLYLILMCTACLLFITAHLLPWRFIFLVIGYTVTATGHPTIQSLITTTHTDEFLRDQETKSRSTLIKISRSDILLSSSPEVREVEIFELQHRALHDSDGEYESFLFSPNPYVPLSPSRIAGDRPRGTPFFEDVKPPRGWRWSDKKWTLDLLSREWVEERCVTSVEVEIEGERWVTDLVFERGEEVWTTGKKVVGKGETTGKKSEGSKGEWRRRRWVRGVERIPVSDKAES